MRDPIEQNETSDIGDEIKAMQDIFYALLPLNPNARQRALNWAVMKLNATMPPANLQQQQSAGFGAPTPAAPEAQPE